MLLFYTKLNISVKLFIVITITFIATGNNYAHTYNYSLFQYISPKPNSINNSTSNNIIIGFDHDLNIVHQYSKSLISVTGQMAGTITGSTIIRDKLLIFYPDSDFLPGDKITVDFSWLARTLGDLSASNHITFSVSNSKSNLTRDVIDEIYADEFGGLSTQSDSDSRPIDFPELTIEKYDDPADGKLFMGIFGSNQKPSILITENTANPIFYLETESILMDFKKQVNGWLTYFDSGTSKFYALNNRYELVDSFYCKNGFETDLHEILLLNNGHCYLLGLDPQIIDMSVLVEGGKEDATVLGFVIQELDQNKNVVFQWRSLDYISVLDASDEIDLTAQVIDYIHTNSIAVDFDGNLIISSRNLDEITKINKQTGEIIWRLGGKKNQFSFINEEYKFYRQHDARRIQNGNILLFDNGNYHTPQFSRAVEYKLNEETFVATKVWQYRNNPDYYTSAMGNVRRLSNGNTLINWSRGGYITEVRPDGTKALEIKYPSELYSYRVFKSNWTASLYESQMDSITFGEVIINNTLSKQVVIQSNSEKEITLTGIFNSLSEFSTSTAFPVIIPSFGEVTLDIKFTPLSEGSFADTLNVRSDSDSSIINSQIYVSGFGTTITHTEETNNEIKGFSLKQNYPNPFNPSTIIQFHVPSSSIVKLKVYDMLGKEIATLVNEKKSAGNYNVDFNADDLPSGVYIYKLSSSGFTQSKKMLLIK